MVKIPCTECFKQTKCILAAILAMSTMAIAARSWLGSGPHISTANAAAYGVSVVLIYLAALMLTWRHE